MTSTPTLLGRLQQPRCGKHATAVVERLHHMLPRGAFTVVFVSSARPCFYPASQSASSSVPFYLQLARRDGMDRCSGALA